MTLARPRRDTDARRVAMVGLVLGCLVAIGACGAEPPAEPAAAPSAAPGTPTPSPPHPSASLTAEPTSPQSAGSPSQPATLPTGPVLTAGSPSPTATPPAQLPGGGRLVFADRMYVALYGQPGSRALGLLGEQGTAATITRAKEFAERYEPYTKRAVIPALEIIATVASASAGKDGDYSDEASVAHLLPLVTAAGKSGVYVVLDLQPGRTDFLTQAKRYESLLRLPHVGLALDPEWRLKPNQRHLRQIGSVSAEEINTVSAWLATVTAHFDLPQKMFLLHQFQLAMIRHRDQLDTHHSQLAFVIQMDGQGTQPAKQDTWWALRQDAPPRMHFGWKNFIDEDSPMLTPKQTMTQVKPKPVWVSYQ